MMISDGATAKFDGTRVVGDEGGMKCWRKTVAGGRIQSREGGEIQKVPDSSKCISRLLAIAAPACWSISNESY